MPITAAGTRSTSNCADRGGWDGECVWGEGSSPNCADRGGWEGVCVWGGGGLVQTVPITAASRV